ncbi:MAG: hypothetical protein KC609_09615 [Myxococcales bacterium]|nr:hypothetical protein [Myxococcales bacterium]
MNELRILGLNQLEALYAVSSNWTGLIAALEQELSRSSAPDEQAELRRRLARAHQNAAAACLEQAETLDFRSGAEPSGKAPTTSGVDVPPRSIQGVDSAAGRLAAMTIEEMEDERYRNPESIEILEALERMYRGAERWHDVLEVMLTRSELTADSVARIELLCRAAETVWENQRDGYQTIELYERVLALDATNRRALDRLEELYTAHDMFYELLELYRRRCDASDTADERIRWLYRAADCHQAQLMDHFAAIDRLREILALDPLALEAMTRLEQIYGLDERWVELVSILERRVELSTSDAERVALYQQIATLNEEMLDDAGAARDAATRALAIDPTNEEARSTIERLS